LSSPFLTMLRLVVCGELNRPPPDEDGPISPTTSLCVQGSQASLLSGISKIWSTAVDFLVVQSSAVISDQSSHRKLKGQEASLPPNMKYARGYYVRSLHCVDRHVCAQCSLLSAPNYLMSSGASHPIKKSESGYMSAGSCCHVHTTKQ
jgi:hypothetical protein